MDRPENVKLKPYFDKLSTVKKEVDARLGPSGPISWADLVYVAGKVATRKKWLNEKVDKLQGKMSSEMVQQSYGTPWTARIGRVDAEEADPAGRIPGPGASLEELRDFYLKFDNPKPEDKGSFLGGKAPYNQRYSYLLISLMAEDRESIQQQMASLDPEWAKAKEKYDISLKTLTRTEYEIDTSRLYNKIMQIPCGSRAGEVPKEEVTSELASCNRHFAQGIYHQHGYLSCACSPGSGIYKFSSLLRRRLSTCTLSSNYTAVNTRSFNGDVWFGYIAASVERAIS
eukprot:scaffold102_cov340-Pavlova_lutheri.AAC.64